eukprot:3260701-Lingulodinium_polyedra.AAC.1
MGRLMEPPPDVDVLVHIADSDSCQLPEVWRIVLGLAPAFGFPRAPPLRAGADHAGHPAAAPGCH